MVQFTNHKRIYAYKYDMHFVCTMVGVENPNANITDGAEIKEFECLEH